MMKVVNSRKGKKAKYLAATLALIAFLQTSPVAHAAEVGDVLYVETGDTYTQEYTQSETNVQEYETERTAVRIPANVANVTVDQIGNETVKQETLATTNTSTGDVVYEEGGRREYGENEFIDADNWSQEQDKDKDAGEYIPDYVEDEVDVKLDGDEPTDKPTDKPTPTPKPTPEDKPKPTPTPEDKPEVKPTPTPTPEEEDIPKLGEENSCSKSFYGGLAIGTLGTALMIIYNKIKEAKEQAAESIKNTSNVHQVVDSKKKYAKQSNTKKLK